MAFTIYNPTDDYPQLEIKCGNGKAAFYDEMNTALIPPQPYNFKEDYLDTDTYDIIMVKSARQVSQEFGIGGMSAPKILLIILLLSQLIIINGI